MQYLGTISRIGEDASCGLLQAAVLEASTAGGPSGASRSEVLTTRSEEISCSRRREFSLR